MKNLKKLSIVLALNIFASLLFAQNNTSETYYTSINPNEANTVFLDLKGEVEMEVWEEDYILLYMEIDAQVTSEKVLNQLRDDGRYLLKKEMSLNNYLMISQPNINKLISINGKAFEENLKYKVKIPMYLDVEISTKNNMVVYQESSLFEETEGNLLSMTQIKQ